MIWKILKWTGITILSLVVILAVIVACRQNLQYDAPFPVIKAVTDSAVIARGREIAFGAAHCADCHSSQNVDSLLKLGLEVPLAGGKVFSLPLGEFYTKNITPDAETGIGRMTDAQIARLLRFGVAPDGTAVLDLMPYHNTSDEDLVAILSFLRSLKPIKNKVPEHQVNLMGKVIKAFLLKPVGPDREVPKTMVRDTSVAYGEYLAYSVANCNGCHTERDMTGAYIGEPYAGGGPMGEPGQPVLFPPNLTTHPESRIYTWSEQDFLNRFRQGRLIHYSHMPWDSYKRMSDNDLKAIYKFLKTVKAAKTRHVSRPHTLSASNCCTSFSNSLIRFSSSGKFLLTAWLRNALV